MHIGQSEITPIETVRKSLVIHPQQVEQRGVQIVDAGVVLHDPIAKCIGRSIVDTPFDSPAGKLGGKRMRVVITTARPL